MSVDFTCADGGSLAAYLYGESEPAERAAIEAHLAICAACAAELASLGATRSALASWTPPETELGFQIVSARDASAAPSNVLRPARWWQRPMPAWAQAAAALLIFAVGGVLGMRAGGAQSTLAPVVVSQSSPDTAITPASRDDLAALEQRLRGEMTQLRAANASAVRDTTRSMQTSVSDEQLVQRIRVMLAESEQRQRRELAFRLSQVVRDVDSQRRMDLARIEQTFGQMEGMTAPELRQQRQAIDYLIRTASQRPQ